MAGGHFLPKEKVCVFYSLLRHSQKLHISLTLAARGMFDDLLWIFSLIAFILAIHTSPNETKFKQFYQKIIIIIINLSIWRRVDKKKNAQNALSLIGLED